MFGRRLFGGHPTRRMIGTLAAILAAVGGILVLLVATSQRSFGIIAPLILGLASLYGALRIHRASKALLAARTRLTASGLLTMIVGIIAIVLALGLGGVLAAVGGITALIATAF